MYRDTSIRNQALAERLGDGRNSALPLSLLAPARDKEVAKAAIQAGADAVYMGAPAFGARQAAGNSIADLAEVVRYARPYGVEVLVTLNTLLHEDEYPQAVALAHELYRIGVDALIVQDLHLLDFPLPPIRLHASTQCDNRTPEQVARLRDLGFRRVVLARELGVDEIRAIHAAVPEIELEAFVHGALCVSYSGRCYISEVLAGRSANRGACAQFCRMAYDLLDGDGNEVPDGNGEPLHQRYLLSLQDMDRSAYLQEMIEAGVTTFKIEGRLKDADYVTNVTAYYRDAIGRCAGEHIFRRSFTPNPEKTFHRGGIDYFLHGRTRPIANWDTPKSTGEYIGEVTEAKGNALRVRLKKGVTLRNGDGLTAGGEGFYVNGVEGNVVKINKTLSPGFPAFCPLYRNYDTEFVKSLHSERRIPLDVVFREVEDGFELGYYTTDGRMLAGRHITGTCFEPARNEEKAYATIRTQLAKLGETPYIARKVHMDCAPCFIPVSILNEWRRSLFENPKAKDDVPAAVAAPVTMSPVGSGFHASEGRGSRPLMECKYCILHELGHCRKTHPYPKEKEPRYLRLRTGRVLALRFDCKNCQMTIDEC